jgi:glycosyltransferase involved in cell wall biosynthesis
MNSITGIIITLNEENNIADCITSLRQVCNEIVVVDSGSSDHTVTIAEEMGAVIMIQPYLGDGFQKNVGLPKAGNDWILSLDADERLTDEMVSAIRELDLEKATVDAFAFPGATTWAAAGSGTAGGIRTCACACSTGEGPSLGRSSSTPMWRPRISPG